MVLVSPPRATPQAGGQRLTDVTTEAGVAGNVQGKGVAVFDIDGDGDLDLFVANDTVAGFLFQNQGDGKFKGLAGALSSGAGDNAVLEGFFYQLYANAAKLVGYRIGNDGALTKVSEVSVPRNSTQGLGKI